MLKEVDAVMVAIRTMNAATIAVQMRAFTDRALLVLPIVVPFASNLKKRKDKPKTFNRVGNKQSFCRFLIDKIVKDYVEENFRIGRK